MKNLLLTLAFDGSRYHGWQIQTNAVTVQQLMQEAVFRVLQRDVSMTGCSRTDSGVHARMFCCNFKTDTAIPLLKLQAALNANLPRDIVVSDIREVPEDFHARYSCTEKEYVYQIWNHPCRNPFLDRYALQVRGISLDLTQLNRCCTPFLGTHDFAGFCSAGSSVKDTVRTLYSMSFLQKEEHLVEFSVRGNGFLYNMVRILVGTLLDVSLEKIGEDALPCILASKDRSRAGKTAAAHGLFLHRVFYPDGILD